MSFLRRFRSRRGIFGLVIVVVLVGAGGAIINSRTAHQGHGAEQGAKQAAKYHCPMHPTYTSDRPGSCPICGMDLVLIGDEGESDTAGMPSIDGLSAIKMSDPKRQLIGVRSTEAVTTYLTKNIRTVGTVEPDETKLAEVNTKIDGWVEKLYVDYTGQLVRKGQPLLAIYSQELLASQEEYLLALRAQKRLSNSPFSEVSKNSFSLAKRARQRLELWDIPESEIRQLEKTGKPKRTVTLRAPFAGYVMHRGATEGVFVKAGEPLFKIADLSRVWVQADIYEYEMSQIKVGQQAELTLDAYPGRTWMGKVDYIYPYLERDTRTLKVRFVFSNPGLTLKPNMFANIHLSIPLGQALTVPEEAIVDTGKRQVLFVDNGEGNFEPREVKVGQRVDGKMEILSGLFEGERVVINGNFMIDSESRLKAALSDISGDKSGEKAPEDSGGEHAGHGM
ncbi:MAG: efflux RND transporter periplasmic adaptor subunit [Armatimonadetes bacterium]|nr:efflux RND transporter periplasmic adaptor subunit [Armatimonadota bacterium]